MTRPALRVIPTSNSKASAEGSEKHAIIATTEPEPFLRRFDAQINKTVFIADNGPDAVAALEGHHIDLFFADYRQLNDNWTGQRFLRLVRLNDAYAHIQFFLMAETWHPHQEQWGVKCGAKGFVKRSPDTLAKHILGAPPTPPFSHLESALAKVDAVFAKFAGPMRTIHIEDAREALTLGQIEPSLDSYIADLTVRLATEDRRRQFKAAMESASKEQEAAMTAAGDPWMEAVNAVFKRFAGGVGAKLMISRSLEHMEMTGNSDRRFYVADLADRLLNPGRRSEFLSALRKDGLIE